MLFLRAFSIPNNFLLFGAGCAYYSTTTVHVPMDGLPRGPRMSPTDWFYRASSRHSTPSCPARIRSSASSLKTGGGVPRPKSSRARHLPVDVRVARGRADGSFHVAFRAELCLLFRRCGCCRLPLRGLRLRASARKQCRRDIIVYRGEKVMRRSRAMLRGVAALLDGAKIDYYWHGVWSAITRSSRLFETHSNPQ